MSSPTRETDPLLPHATVAATGTPSRKPSFSWLAPVVAIASICRGISMFARFEHYQKTLCPPGVYFPCGYFATWLELPRITVHMPLWSLYASFVVSFITVGWWSELGDRRGRKLVLFFPVLGTAILDLIYHLVANVSLPIEDARDILSLALIIEGLLGGYATYVGAVYAYAFDVAPTPLHRLVFFGFIQAISLLGFIIGAIIGRLTHYTTSYAFSVAFAALNLVLIYALLPESLQPQPTVESSTPRRPLPKSIVSPMTVFFRGTPSRKRLPLFALAFYAFSLTSAMDTSIIRYTRPSYFPDTPSGIIKIVPRIITLATLFGILPGIVYIFARTHASTASTERAALKLTTPLAQHSLLAALFSAGGILLFCVPSTSQRSPILYTVFALVQPFTALAAPALYALGASYLVTLGRKSEIGELFGAMGVWGLLAQVQSYSWYGYGSNIFWLSAFWLIIALVCLLPDAPTPTEPDEQE